MKIDPFPSNNMPPDGQPYSENIAAAIRDMRDIVRGGFDGLKAIADDRLFHVRDSYKNFSIPKINGVIDNTNATVVAAGQVVSFEWETRIDCLVVYASEDILISKFPEMTYPMLVPSGSIHNLNIAIKERQGGSTKWYMEGATQENATVYVWGLY